MMNNAQQGSPSLMSVPGTNTSTSTPTLPPVSGHSPPMSGKEVRNAAGLSTQLLRKHNEHSPIIQGEIFSGRSSTGGSPAILSRRSSRESLEPIVKKEFTFSTNLTSITENLSDTASNTGSHAPSGVASTAGSSNLSSSGTVAHHGVRIRNTLEAIVGEGVANRVRTSNVLEGMDTEEKASVAPFLAEVITKLTSMDTCMIVMDPSCTIQIASPSVGKVFGYSSDELTGNNINVLMPEALARKHDGIVRRYTETSHITKERSTVVNETRPAQAKHKDGSAIPIEISVRAMRDNDGQPFMYIGLIRDTRLEADMRTSLRESEQLETSFPFPYICANETGTIEKFNPAAENTFGYSATYAIGRTVNLLLPPKIRKRHSDMIRSYVQRIRDAGVDAVRSNIVGRTTQQMALRLPTDADAHGSSHHGKKRGGKANALGLDMFKIELQLRVYLSREGDVKFYAFVRDLDAMRAEALDHGGILNEISGEGTGDSLPLDQVFPARVAQEIRETGSNRLRSKEVSVLFCNIVGFSRICEMMQTEAAFEVLESVFARFDEIVAGINEVMAVRASGDTYMIVGGLYEDKNSVAVGHMAPHAVSVVAAAQRILTAVEDYRAEMDTDLQVRIGIHTGEASAGVVKSGKPHFDVLGKCVSMASRAEETGLPGCIHITENTYFALPGKVRSHFLPREDSIHFKGIGDKTTYIGKGEALEMLVAEDDI